MVTVFGLAISIYKIVEAACIAGYITALYYVGQYGYKAYVKYQKGEKK